MSSKDENNSIQKYFQIIFALSGHTVDGLSAGELSRMAHISASDATRCRKRLMALGYVEEIPSLKCRYRLGPKLIQIANAHLHSIAREQQKIDEVAQRYSVEPR